MIVAYGETCARRPNEGAAQVLPLGLYQGLGEYGGLAVS